MKTRGSGVVYEHPNVHYPAPLFEMNYGWYAQFMDIRKASEFHLFEHKMSPFYTEESIQATYICQEFETIKDLKSVCSVLKSYRGRCMSQNTIDRIFSRKIVHIDEVDQVKNTLLSMQKG